MKIRLRPHRLTLLLAAIAALGAGLTLAGEAAYGVRLSADSLHYLEMAQNLLAGNGFTLHSGNTTDLWPPLYPLLLAAASLGVFNPADTAGLLNAAIFGLTIFAVGQYLRRRLQSRFMVLWVCLSIALSIPLVEVASWALAGSLFILMLTLALIQTDNFLFEGKISALLWAGIFSALAWQARYIGVALPVFVALLLLLQTAPLRQRAWRVAVYSLIVGIPMALWMLRNYLAGSLPGERKPIEYSLPGLVGDALETLWRWAHFDLPLAWGLSLALPALTFGALAAAGCLLLRAQWKNRTRFDWRLCYVFGGFALTYLILLITALMLSQVKDGLSDRYMAPLYIPLIVVAAVTLDHILDLDKKTKLLGSVVRLPVIRTLAQRKIETPGLLTTALALILFAWVVAQIIPNSVQISHANNAELWLGYSDPRWANSETLHYLRQNPVAGRIYSNEPSFLFSQNTGAESYRAMPNTARDAKHDPDHPGNIYPNYGQEELEAFLAGIPDGSHVVWFSNWYNISSYYFGYANMRVTPGLEPIAELSDGAVYQVNRDYIPPANPFHSAYNTIRSGEYRNPAFRNVFDVYLNDAQMIYLKEQCQVDDIQKIFSLRLTPAYRGDLPAHRRAWSTDYRDFSFRQYGVIFDDVCLAMVPLPGYEIAKFSTGQYTPGEARTWQVRQDYVSLSSGWSLAYQAITSGEYGEPAIKSTFDVYIDDTALLYFKEPCGADDTQNRFSLHLIPTDAGDLPAHRRDYSFDNLDFSFGQYGVTFNDLCLAIVPFPGYEIARIRTGQRSPDAGSAWYVEQDYVPPTSPYQLAYDAIESGEYRDPAIGGVFDVYRNDDELIYLKEPCAAADTEARFYLHVYPADAADLPAERREYGFDNPDFQFTQHGVQWAGKCLAIVPLPNYQIARIRTGQYIVGGEQIWKAEQYIIDGNPVSRVQQDDLPPSSPYQSAYNAITSGDYGPPATGGTFDVYRNGGEMIYLKELCAAADTEARFYLHVYPADTANLPAERREYGFDNPDFQFPQHGVRWAGRCLAIVPLPGYEIARIRTGQYIVGGERLWQVDFR